MNLQSAGKAAGEMTRLFLNQPRLGFRRLRNLLRPFSGFLYPRDEKTFSTKQAPDCPADQAAASNPLIDYFESHHEGRGIWKWVHYFDIYHRHFSKYVGREVHIVEIGVYSGGSLDLWKHYFGPRCHVYGVDIKESCKDYEDETTRILIGNQGDRRFWKRFKSEVPHVDILVDDGGHHTDHQIVTLEEMLPHLRPGGVYVCEDVTGVLNGFAVYVYGLADNLNAFARDGQSTVSTPFQRAIASIHLYPFMTVIEKHQIGPKLFRSRRHGSEW